MCAYLCQSCMTPLETEIDFGTNEDKTKNNDYCNMCFRDGKFINPTISLSKMIEEVVIHMMHVKNIDEQTARQIINNKMPTLKRWTKTE